MAVVYSGDGETSIFAKRCCRVHLTATLKRLLELRGKETMISWLTWVYALLLLGVTVAALAWVYRRTRLPAVLTYLLYTVISRFFVPGAYTDAIANGDAGKWLGANAGDRVANYFWLTSAVESTVQTLLFLWLVLSLVGWSRSRTDGPLWRGKKRPITPTPDTA